MLDKADYWFNLCDEDLEVAKVLLSANKYLQMGFFCHLTVEKALKAVIAHNSNGIPPKIHDLIKLANYGKLYNVFSEEQCALLERLTPLQLEARYPEYKERIAKNLNDENCKRLLNETEELLHWIKQKLGK
ncbi:MAG: HEPN domain-containing protein [Oscillospiraceae bacterium]|nr:HEPN domain-containing protein [Oscillospiraceae bacterium]